LQNEKFFFSFIVFMFFCWFMVLLLFAALICVVASSNWVLTPFGHRLRQCVVQASSVEVWRGNLLLDGKTRFAVPPECHSESSWKRSGSARRGKQQQANITCGSLPCDDWLSNAGSLTPQTWRGFSGDYLVPSLPQNDFGQTLFYFLGLENTNGIARSGPNRVILQPVLTYGNGVF
jgi:hypothetical protein